VGSLGGVRPDLTEYPVGEILALADPAARHGEAELRIVVSRRCRDEVPEALRDRQLHDGLVVQALESWASVEAAKLLVGVFLVAAAVMAIALVPALTLERRILGAAPATTGGGQTDEEDDGGAAYAL